VYREKRQKRNQGMHKKKKRKFPLTLTKKEGTYGEATSRWGGKNLKKRNKRVGVPKNSHPPERKEGEKRPAGGEETKRSFGPNSTGEKDENCPEKKRKKNPKAWKLGEKTFPRTEKAQEKTENSSMSGRKFEHNDARSANKETPEKRGA